MLCITCYVLQCNKYKVTISKFINYAEVHLLCTHWLTKHKHTLTYYVYIDLLCICWLTTDEQSCAQKQVNLAYKTQKILKLILNLILLLLVMLIETQTQLIIKI